MGLQRRVQHLRRVCLMQLMGTHKLMSNGMRHQGARTTSSGAFRSLPRRGRTCPCRCPPTTGDWTLGASVRSGKGGRYVVRAPSPSYLKYSTQCQVVQLAPGLSLPIRAFRSHTVWLQVPRRPVFQKARAVAPGAKPYGTVCMYALCNLWAHHLGRV